MWIYADMPIEARDGACGSVMDALLDPVELTGTHLVVKRPGLVSLPHLVPGSVVDQGTDDLSLTWTTQPRPGGHGAGNGLR